MALVIMAGTNLLTEKAVEQMTMIMIFGGHALMDN